LTEIFQKNRYNGQRSGCNVSVGRYNHGNTEITETVIFVKGRDFAKMPCFAMFFAEMPWFYVFDNIGNP